MGRKSLTVHNEMFLPQFRIAPLFYNRRLHIKFQRPVIKILMTFSFLQ